MTMVGRTCEAMARGGMYDQLGGGFARYSVDAGWVVPHFEKMLYDNALLLGVYAHWWRRTRNPLAERVVSETVDWLIREMRTPQGGFAASLDADSLDEQGHLHEGAFYVWKPDQLTAALGSDDGSWAAEVFTVTAAGTFEAGASTLQLLADPDDWARFAAVRDRLRQARNARPRPARDDKVVAAWNGWLVDSLVQAAMIFDRPEWLAVAVRGRRGGLAGALAGRTVAAGVAGRPAGERAGDPGGLRRAGAGECAAGRGPGRPVVAGSGPVAAGGGAGSVRRRRRGVLRHGGRRRGALHPSAGPNATTPRPLD